MINKTGAAKASNNSPDVSLDELQRQFETLKDDISALSTTVIALGAVKKNEAIMAGSDHASALANRGKAALDQAEDTFGTLLHDLEKTVRAKPNYRACNFGGLWAGVRAL